MKSSVKWTWKDEVVGQLLRSCDLSFDGLRLNLSANKPRRKQSEKGKYIDGKLVAQLYKDY